MAWPQGGLQTLTWSQSLMKQQAAMHDLRPSIPTTPVTTSYPHEMLIKTPPKRRSKYLTAEMASPAPALMKHSAIGMHALKHPSLLVYPEVSAELKSHPHALQDMPPWQLGLMAIKPQSFPAYLSTYSSVWNVYSHTLIELS